MDTFIEKEKKEESPWPPTVDSLTSSHQKYPVSLELLFNNLLKSKTHLAGEIVHRHVDSLTQDIVHSVSNGNITRSAEVLKIYDHLTD